MTTENQNHSIYKSEIGDAELRDLYDERVSDVVENDWQTYELCISQNTLDEIHSVYGLVEYLVSMDNLTDSELKEYDSDEADEMIALYRENLCALVCMYRKWYAQGIRF